MDWWRLSLLVLAGCAHAPQGPELTGPTQEMRLDDGQAQEKLALPDRSHELLMHFDAAERVPLTLKLMLAAPGRAVISFYKTSAEGSVGELVQRIERDYSTLFVSNGKDGRWVLERLSIPTLHAPLWIGLWGTGAVVWASSHDSTWTFQRDPNPSVALYSGRIARTPLVRVEVAPAVVRK